ncbi:superoxide dismutase, Cu-Zn family [Amphibacillus marinus]|uniref:Superoxide dismutase [Cu-Zn] n=1 Tax=Amphibacillus marinus TaxID=872970 RepID=A0A1H8PP72_9BACI|nr:superoxide dismutase family protein [Amphibacillus marinus]SEO43586.1 superoxide dismutase, Cu-Zn family [Amphibacillus marinus]
MKTKYWLLAMLFFATVSLAGCNNENSQQAQDYQTRDEEAVETGADAEEMVEVTLMNRDGQQVALARLTEKPAGGVRIVLEGENLPPGEHGFHIHEAGECIPPDFESAGGHYNPTDKKHGFDHPEGPHAGDLPNITVKEDGTVYAEVDAPMVTLKKGAPNTLFPEQGTSLMIHADPDDYVSQPAGNSGERIACGVIGE